MFSIQTYKGKSGLEKSNDFFVIPGIRIKT